MISKKYNNFYKRYDKFKKNNLPTPYWDNERQTYEFVFYNNKKSIFNTKKTKKLEVKNNIVDALSDIASTGLYYSFTSKKIHMIEEKGKIIKNVVIDHNHAHSFDEVVKSLYDSPESFKISKEDEEFYSKQELEYLRRVQKYLLFIDLKDFNQNKNLFSRYRNKKHSKYENAIIHRFSDKVIKDVLDGKIDFIVIDWYQGCIGDEKYKKHDFQALVVDKEDNFIMFIEYIKKEVKLYEDIKQIYKIDNLKDNDKVILRYFKVLEIFEK